jgi:hypothetical protein
MPMIEPLIATSAPSPPLEPPAVSHLLHGLAVGPKMWFVVSSTMSVCGTLVWYRASSVACAGRNIDWSAVATDLAVDDGAERQE